MLINGDNSIDLTTDMSEDMQQNDSFFYDNIGDHQDLLSALSQDLDIPMLLDQDPFTALLESPLSSDSITENPPWTLDDIISYELNESQDNIKQEYKHEPVSPLRSTPSPSSLSNSSNEINLENLKNEVTINNHLDTPPISPQEGCVVSPKISFQHESLMQPVVIAQNPVQYIQIPQDNMQIITKSTPGALKRPLIQPKPINGAVITKRKNSIVLSPQQFANLAKLGKLKNDITEIKQDLVNINNGTTINPPQKAKPIQNFESRPGSSLLNVDKDLESRAFKKHQRMIKNRASACLSRKKKKEYLTSLENKVAELTQENNILKQENAQLRARLSAQCMDEEKSNQHPNLINISANARKNTAFLLAMLVMVSFNIGSFGFNNMFMKTDISAFENSEISKDVPVGRHLLWVDDQNLDYDSAEIKINLTSMPSKFQDFKTQTGIHPICPMYINISESMRLESELRKWIGIKQQPPLTSSFNKSNIENPEIKPNISLELITNKPNRDIDNPRLVRRHTIKDKAKSKVMRRRKVIMDKIPETYSELDVFDPNNYGQDFEFYEAIKRRDDTFYVVSFHLDHLLLPALAHNNTSRPKMSLLMPVLGKNNSFGEIIQLMQIDCEVTNTSLVKLEYNQIPRHLRPDKKFHTQNYESNNSLNLNGTTGTTKSSFVKKAAYKPYFIRGGLLAEKSSHSKSNSSRSLN